MIYRTEKNRRLRVFLVSLACILDGLIGVFSLGFYGSSYTFTVAAHLELKELRKRK